MERTVKIVLGDWSADGHGKTKTFFVKLSGEDVSDEILNANYQTMTKTLSMDLADVCADYEDFSIDAAFYQQLLRYGFVQESHNHWPAIYVEDVWGDNKEEVLVSPIALAMFYVGYKIPDFSWEVVNEEVPILLGGSQSIVAQASAWSENDRTHSTSFCYGLFS